jgi:hypothetical protein
LSRIFSLTPEPRTASLRLAPFARSASNLLAAGLYELADGTRHEYPFGLVQIEIMDEVTAGRVIFGPDGVEPLVGIATLESAGLTIDPTTQR